MLRREFIVDRAGIATEANPEEVLRHMGISPQLSAAYEICEDAGFDMEQATPLLAAAEKDGQNPEEFARHICKLRRAARGVKDLGI